MGSDLSPPPEPTERPPTGQPEPPTRAIVEGLGAPIDLGEEIDDDEVEGDFGSGAFKMCPEAICPGQAQMRQVVNYRKYPWSALVYVRASFKRFGNDPLVISGSGWMYTPGFIMTAAHNVFKHAMANGARRAIKVELFAGYAPGQGQVAARTEIAEEDVFFSPRFASGPAINRPFDYAFLRVRDPGFVGAIGAPLPIATVGESCRDSVLVSGYPMPNGRGIRVRKGWLHTGEGFMAGGDGVTHRYGIETLGGQSGGPVIWVNPADHTQIASVGIHVHGECPYNMARRIDPALAKLANRVASGAVA